MADEDFDSLEQSERARSWFQKNGSAIVIGVMGAMAVIWGYKAFQTNAERSAHAAGLSYELLTKAVSEKDNAKVNQLAAELRRSHGNTTYAALGSLAEAKYLMDSGKTKEAQDALGFAQAGELDVVKQIAQLRVARLLNGNGKPQEALDVLAKINDEGLKSQLEQIKGDSYVQLGKLAEAKAAYAAALTATDLATPGRATLQQKLDNLGG
jgi:predicted negative regulator of RcsB-dependent stress response